MRWATRAGVHIGRAASAWLVRRFIDAEAQFVFVTDLDDVPAEFFRRELILGRPQG